MIVFNILGTLLTIIIISLGLYFLVIKEDKNKYSLITGFLDLTFGVIGLFICIFFLWMD